MAANSTIKIHTFHSNVTSPSVGTDYAINGQADLMRLDFDITDGTTFTALIQVKMKYDSDWKPYPVIKDAPTYDISTTVTDATYLYEVDVRAIESIRVELTTVNGTVSEITGRLVG